jgi:hypothetical protein
VELGLGQQAEEEQEYHQLKEGLAGQVQSLEIIWTTTSRKVKKIEKK